MSPRLDMGCTNTAPMRSRDTLSDFIRYCKAHPSERFWQALRNWAGFNFILASNTVGFNDIQDTFYWEGRDD